MFILATTELNKVPATILSRCQRFAFRRPTAEDITGRINYVAYQEGIDLTTEAAELLGRLAGGAFRDGLSLLDQCASASVGTLDVEGVYRTLGLAGQQQTGQMMRAIGERDTGKALRLFSDLYAEGKDAAAMLGELSTLARDMLIVKTAPKSGLGMISSTCTAQEVKALSPLFTPEELLRCIDLIQATTNSFKNSVNERVDGELCLIHLCQPELSIAPKDLSARISRVEEDLTERLLGLEQKLRNGTFVAGDEAPPWEEEAPPWDDRDAPPVPMDAPPEEEPPAPSAEDPQWLKLRERVLPDVEPMVRPFVQGISGKFQGDTLVLSPKSQLDCDMLKKYPDFLEQVRKKAAVLLGRSVHVRMCGQSSLSPGGDMLSELAESMKGFENMTVKD